MNKLHYPLTSSQQPVWMEQVFKPESPLYNIGGRYELHGPINLKRLQYALDYVIAHTDALKINITSQGLQTNQYINHELKYKLPCIDFSAYNDAKERAIDYCQTQMAIPFDVMSDCLWRLHWLKISPNESALCVVFHHLIVDGTGGSLFLEFLSETYTKMDENGNFIDEMPVRPSYLNFVDKDISYRNSAKFETDQLYWQTKFKSLPDPVLLKKTNQYNDQPFIKREFELTQQQFDQIQTVASQFECSPTHFFTTLIAVYFSLMNDGRNLVNIGMPVHNRGSAQLRKTIGMMASVIPVAVEFERNNSFADTFIAVAAELKRAYKHQKYPLHEIIRQLRPLNEGKNQLFDIQLSVENYPSDNLFCNVPSRKMPLNSGYGSHPLSIYVRNQEKVNNVQIEFNFDRNYFDNEEVSLHVSRLTTMIATVVETPTMLIGDYTLATEAEIKQQLFNWNDCQSEYDAEAMIHQIFEHYVEQSPDQTAVVFGSQSMSYAQLNAHANKLAHYLIEQHGVKSGNYIGICLNRSIEMMIAILATLKAGGIYVALDPNYPSDRLAYMMEDSGVSLLLSNSACRQSLNFSKYQVIELNDVMIESSDAPWLNYTASNLTDLLSQQSDELAYLIYTSGSTGQPKGVMCTHRGIVNLAHNQRLLFNISATSKVLHYASISFDAGTWDWVMALLNGATLVVSSESERIDPKRIEQLFKIQQITHVTLPPAFLANIACTDDYALQCLIVAGEACEQDLMALWAEKYGFYNAYGPSEASVCATVCKLSSDSEVHIGRPLGNVSVFVLDEYQKMLPIGSIGQLYIGGVGLAHGYLNKPELTAEKFISNPFFAANPSSGERLYRSGDLVRYLPSGELKFVGRADDQVKVRGFRVELGEIEHALNQLEAVHSSVVLTKRQSGTNQLIAYVIPEQIVSEQQAAEFVFSLQSELEKHLPAHMVPGSFSLIDKWPVTPNGKIDKKALLTQNIITLQGEYIAPETETERYLAQMWSEILGVEQISAAANFFQLGGHSLLLMQLASKLQSIGKGVKVHTLFTIPILREMASYLDSYTHEEPEFKVPKNGIAHNCDYITPHMLPLIELSQLEIDAIADKVPDSYRNIQDIYPLAPLQEGVLFVHTLNPHQDPYVTTAAFEFADVSQFDQFKHALDAVIARHDVLRTAIFWQGRENPLQVVLRTVSLPVLPLVLNSKNTLKQAFMSYVEEHQPSLDLEAAPLMKLEVTESDAEGQCYALLTFHHLITDHVSLDILVTQLQQKCTMADFEIETPQLYREFIARTLAHKDELDIAAFFKDKLGDIETPTLPFQLTEVTGNGGAIDDLHLSLAPQLSADIRAISRQHQLSPAALFHLAWAKVIATCCASDDVVFGTVLSGRMSGMLGIEKMMGMMINTLPLRVNMQQGSLLQQLQQVDFEIKALIPYEQVSLAQAQRFSGIDGNGTLFSAILNYRHSVAEQDNILAQNGHRQWTLLSAKERTNYPFGVSVNDFGHDFSLEFQIDKAVGAQSIAAYMQTALQNLVAQLLGRSDNCELSNCVLSENELKQQLIDWQAAPATYPKKACIHEVFEQRVADTPDAIALSCNEQVLSYRQLNERANQVAHYLQNRHQIGANSRVGLCIGRSVEMIIGTLAILKAGAAYVPLDPQAPQSRLAYMLEDTAVSVILTAESQATALHFSDVPQICLDQHDALISQQSSNNLSRATGLSSESLAYVIYTSGSTGHPKGVMTPHRAVNRLVCSPNFMTLDKETVFLQCATIAFDAATLEIWGPLLNGGRCVLFPDELITLERLNAVLAAQQVTAMWLTSGLFTQWSTACQPGLALEYVLAGGDVLNPQAVKAVQQALPDVSVINGYGPTENTTFTCCYPIPRGRDLSAGVPIGQGVQGDVVLILSAQGSLVPAGVIGELCVGGDGLALGYLNQQAQTQQQFVANLYSRILGRAERLYKTGDLVRYTTDGLIEYVGRVDDQIKIRGFRVELGEIQNRINALDDVEQSLVVCRKDQSDNASIVAYVELKQATPSDQHATDANQIASELQSALPAYMVPSTFVFVQEWPLTSNGKIDKRALPEPDLSFRLQSYVAPSGLKQLLLTKIWSELLGIDASKISSEANFFELGGHSLLMMKIHAQLKKAGFEGETQAIFKAQTLADMALALRASGETVAYQVPANIIPVDADSITPQMLPLIELTQHELEKVCQRVPGGAKNIQDIYPLASLQQGILFAHTLEQEFDPYVISASLTFNDRLQFTRFVDALTEVVARHDILRSLILWRGLEKAVQVVQRNVGSLVEYLEFAAEADIYTAFTQFVVSGNHKIDIEQAPLLRLQVVEDKSSGQVFALFKHHHIITDHVSVELILEELSKIIEGRTTELLPSVPYREFVAKSLHKSKVLDSDAFFKSQLGNVEEPTLPFGFANILGDGSNSKELSYPLNSILSQQLRTLAKQQHISPAVLFHGAWAMVLSHCCNMSEVVFGTVFSGRMSGEEGVDQMLGMLINTLPIKLNLANVTTSAFLEQIRHQLQALIPYEQISLADAQRHSQVAPSTPLFSTTLNFRHSQKMAKSDFEPLYQIDAVHERSNYPLDLSVNDYGDEFTLDFQADVRVPLDLVSDLMTTALTSLVTDMQQLAATQVAQLAVYPSEREQALLAMQCGPKRELAWCCAHHLIAQQVKKSLGRVAVTNGEQFLSYRMLDERANQLAHYLREHHNVGPDTLVGLCVERSLEMMVGVLAILKAGGAYVPLDPAYPKERLAFMVQDTGLTVVLTQQKVATLLDGFNVTTVPICTLQHFNDYATDAPDVPGLTPANLAYVMYTSGSTGTPKGVMVTHRNLVNFAANCELRYDITEADNVLQFSTMNFDIFVEEWLASLSRGASLVLRHEAVSLSREAFIDFCQQHAISVASLPTAFWHQLALSEEELARLSLRLVIVGGEALDKKSVASLKPGFCLLNSYGPTEPLSPPQLCD
ncbi:non-ribosomal peptide synthetase [Pseudoalteromonas tunicata]|nr:non-ribosomal peptide synthetase [Pseudoalteromonas tunicata]